MYEWGGKVIRQSVSGVASVVAAERTILCRIRGVQENSGSQPLVKGCIRASILCTRS